MVATFSVAHSTDWSCPMLLRCSGQCYATCDCDGQCFAIQQDLTIPECTLKHSPQGHTYTLYLLVIADVSCHNGWTRCKGVQGVHLYSRPAHSAMCSYSRHVPGCGHSSSRAVPGGISRLQARAAPCIPAHIHQWCTTMRQTTRCLTHMGGMYGHGCRHPQRHWTQHQFATALLNNSSNACADTHPKCAW